MINIDEFTYGVTNVIQSNVTISCTPNEPETIPDSASTDDVHLQMSLSNQFNISCAFLG